MKLIIDIDDEMVCNDIKYKALEPTTATDEVIIHALYNGVLYEERPKGEWVVQRLQNGFEDVYCPYCNARPRRSDYGYYIKDKFCHECGADMRVKHELGGRE